MSIPFFLLCLSLWRFYRQFLHICSSSHLMLYDYRLQGFYRNRQVFLLLLHPKPVSSGIRLVVIAFSSPQIVYQNIVVMSRKNLHPMLTLIECRFFQRRMPQQNPLSIYHIIVYKSIPFAKKFLRKKFSEYSATQ